MVGRRRDGTSRSRSNGGMQLTSKARGRSGRACVVRGRSGSSRSLSRFRSSLPCTSKSGRSAVVGVRTASLPCRDEHTRGEAATGTRQRRRFTHTTQCPGRREGAFGSRRTHRHRECCQKMQASDRGERGLRDTAWAQAAHERRKCAWVCVGACALAGRASTRRARGEGPSWVRIASRHRIAPSHRPVRGGAHDDAARGRERGGREGGRQRTHPRRKRRQRCCRPDGASPAPLPTANRRKFSILLKLYFYIILEKF